MILKVVGNSVFTWNPFFADDLEGHDALLCRRRIRAQAKHRA